MQTAVVCEFLYFRIRRTLDDTDGARFEIAVHVSARNRVFRHIDKRYVPHGHVFADLRRKNGEHIGMLRFHFRVAFFKRQIDELLSESCEFVVFGNEVRFAHEFDDRDLISLSLNVDAAFRGCAVGSFCDGGESLFF